MNTFVLYLIMMLDNIGVLSIFVSVFGGFLFVFLTVCWLDDCNVGKGVSKLHKISTVALGVVVSISVCLNIFMPTTKQAFILIGYSEVIENKKFLTGEAKELYSELKETVFKKTEEKK